MAGVVAEARAALQVLGLLPALPARGGVAVLLGPGDPVQPQVDVEYVDDCCFLIAAPAAGMVRALAGAAAA
eukprot:5217270-Lingulodinium_polyedra.AAC.1